MKSSNSVLSEILNKAPRGTKQKIAKESYVQPSMISKLSNGSRRITKDVSISISKSLHNMKFNYSSAKEHYKVISFKNDGKVNQDMFSVTTDQKKQEQDRIKVEESTFEILIKPKELWTSEDYLNVKNYLNEFTEEIASEITELLQVCSYAGVSAEKIIDKVNKKIGG